MAAPARSAPVLEGSDPAWGAAFDWACRQAAAYRYDDEPVGPCFEAALPGRRAFCVRDVCHQSTGAQVLGMAAHTKNMLRRFAESISDAKDWCPYWEITRDGAPAAADYRSDARFWYNLPGSFDLVEACHRQFLWTGDADYVDDPVFREFYRRTLGDFVGRWDRDDDGIPDHRPEDGHRGIATYNEQVPDPLVGGDLLGAMYGALRADAAMRDLRGDRAGALGARRRAAALRRRYNREWWDPARGGFAGHRRQDGTFAPEYGYEGNFLPLYFGLPSGGPRVRAALDEMSARGAPNVEGLTYVVDILMRHGRVAEGWALLRRIADPRHPRADYPEVAFCAVGALVAGLAGLRPDAGRGLLETVWRLPAPGAWLRVGPVPVLGGRVTLTHGPEGTRLENGGDRPLRWRALFAEDGPRRTVDGTPASQVRLRRHGRWHTGTDVLLAPGQACTVADGL